MKGIDITLTLFIILIFIALFMFNIFVTGMKDIKDNWPVNFIDPFPIILKPIVKIIISPYFFISKYVFVIRCLG